MVPALLGRLAGRAPSLRTVPPAGHCGYRGEQLPRACCRPRSRTLSIVTPGSPTVSQLAKAQASLQVLLENATMRLA